MSNGYGNGNGGGGRRNDRADINWTALLLAGFVAMCFAVGTGQAEMPNIRDGEVDNPAPPPADAGCTTEEALAVITASGLTVIEWQAAAGIVADGEVGPQTRAAACG